MRSSISVVIVAVAAFSFGCASQSNTSTANTTANSNQAVANANAAANTAAATAPASDVAIGSLATPTEAYKTAYALREKKDVAGLKKIMSKEVLEFLSMMGEADKKSLDDMIKEIFVKPQAAKPESRNEKISGDRASVEYLDEEGDWSTMDFVKEDGVWKMSLPDKGDVQIETNPPAKKSDKP